MPANPGSTVNPDLVAIPFPVIRVENGAISHLDWLNFIQKLSTVTANYQEGSFTGTLSGISGSSSQTYYYIRMFNFVYVTPLGNNTGASNTAGCAITGLPSSLRPARNQAFSVLIESSGAWETGAVSIGTNGLITLVRENGSTTFVNDGLAKGLGSNGFCFSMS